ncbi:hypothetical protein CH63R_06227 [Colletotrichum higginsianum IMI 349063]|uniref:Uncharacterized protein n=1 Tax=Colletotrichum higginsianum (strain IMI 349063) TaxID=759273 RepID=A0A1B7YEX2_COLHI|nr:hypothetical protein CH63R_06227 [Colletotrichum higginsianum IMI 349063]OBR10535.1 hypothetical protein CH63R_06227 [Colletotrichum higginsianum IMI 349063]GJD04812.1 hypothetical protein ColKHC_13637 [Colletotrichum higginsianum]
MSARTILARLLTLALLAYLFLLFLNCSNFLLYVLSFFSVYYFLYWLKRCFSYFFSFWLNCVGFFSSVVFCLVFSWCTVIFLLSLASDPAYSYQHHGALWPASSENGQRAV